MLLFPARVSPWSGRPQGEARGTGGFHQPCTEGKPTARVREHYDSQPGCSLLETHHFSGGRGKMLESPNSRDICLLTKVCISAFLTLGSCFHYYFFFFFSFSPKARRARTFWLFAKWTLSFRHHHSSLRIRILRIRLLYYYLWLQRSEDLVKSNPLMEDVVLGSAGFIQFSSET